MRGGFWTVPVVVGVLLSSVAAHAQCSKDVDCKGERVCEAGQCVAPTTSEPAAAVPAQPPPAAPSLASEAHSQPDTHFFDDESQPRKPKKRLSNPGMMVGGIVIVSLAPVLLVVGVLSTSGCNRDGTDRCDTGARLLGFGLGSLAMIGIGVPLIVMGAKRVPARQVTLAPLLAPGRAGLGLRLDL